MTRGINKSIEENKLEGYVELIGKPCCLVYATRDEMKQPSQPFRTLYEKRNYGDEAEI